MSRHAYEVELAIGITSINKSDNMSAGLSLNFKSPFINLLPMLISKTSASTGAWNCNFV